MKQHGDTMITTKEKSKTKMNDSYFFLILFFQPTHLHFKFHYNQR